MKKESETLKLLHKSQVIPVSYDKNHGMMCRFPITINELNTCYGILKSIIYYKFTFNWNDEKETLDYIDRYVKSIHKGRKDVIRDVEAYIRNEYRLFKYNNTISDYQDFTKEEFYEKIRKDLKKAKFKAPTDEDFKTILRDVRPTDSICYWINNNNRDEFLRTLKLDLNKQRNTKRHMNKANNVLDKPNY